MFFDAVPTQLRGTLNCNDIKMCSTDDTDKNRAKSDSRLFLASRSNRIYVYYARKVIIIICSLLPKHSLRTRKN